MDERSAYIARMASRIRAGYAGAGCLAWFGDEDVTADVRAACERSGLQPHATRAASSSASSMDHAIAGTVTAYVCRWDIIRQGSSDADGTPGPRTAYRRGAFDEWLEDAEPDTVVCRADHRGPVLGRFVSFECDEVGLLGEVEIYDTAEGRQMLADVDSGVFTAFSGHAVDVIAVLAHDDDGEYFDIVQARMVEAGPQHAAADGGSRILAVNGVEVRHHDPLDGMTVAEVMAELEAVTGISSEHIARDARIARHERTRVVEDRVASIDRALAAHQRAWQRHADAVRQRALGVRGAPTFDEINELAADVDEPAEWLSRQLPSDLYRSLVPAKVDLTRAIIAGLDEQARRRRRP